MKKLFSRVMTLTLITIMVASLAACGSTKPEAPVENTPAKKDKYVIGISQPFMGHPIRKAGSVLIDAWAKDHPDVEIIVTDGQLKADKQIADIEDLMSKKVDMLLVAAHQSPTLVGVLREVKDAGIPIIAFDRTLSDTSVQIGVVVNDDYLAGKSAAKILATSLGGKGKIAILQGPAGNTTVSLRQNGFMDALKDYPEIEIISDQVANFQRVQAVDVFENVLQANPDINGVFAHNDEMALGAVKVLKDAGKINDVKVVGLDGQKDALESIIAGELTGTVRKVVEFPASLDMAYEYLTTGKIKEIVYLESIEITKDNVNEYYNPDAVF
ncbi:MAG: substrate-binding domain-containing protein [Clostridia bacterium]